MPVCLLALPRLLSAHPSASPPSTSSVVTFYDVSRLAQRVARLKMNPLLLYSKIPDQCQVLYSPKHEGGVRRGYSYGTQASGKAHIEPFYTCEIKFPKKNPSTFVPKDEGVV